MNLDKLIKIANYFDKNKQFNNADFISKYLKIASNTDEGDSIESIIEGIQKKIEPLVGQPQLTESTPTVRERVPFQRAQEEYLELKSKIISKIAEYKVAMKENNFKLTDIKEVISTLEPLDGAIEFHKWLRSEFEVIILSDTFYQFVFGMRTDAYFIGNIDKFFLWSSDIHIVSRIRVTAFSQINQISFFLCD